MRLCKTEGCGVAAYVDFRGRRFSRCKAHHMLYLKEYRRTRRKRAPEAAVPWGMVLKGGIL
jgi:hypothetical protein